MMLMMMGIMMNLRTRVSNSLVSYLHSALTRALRVHVSSCIALGGKIR